MCRNEVQTCKQISAILNEGFLQIRITRHSQKTYDLSIRDENRARYKSLEFKRVWGLVRPPLGSKGNAPVRVQGGEAPLKLKIFGNLQSFKDECPLSDMVVLFAL